MKVVERVSRWIVVWLSLSLLLKCSALAFDTISVVPKVSYEQYSETLEEKGRGSV